METIIILTNNYPSHSNSIRGDVKTGIGRKNEAMMLWDQLPGGGRSLLAPPGVFFQLPAPFFVKNQKHCVFPVGHNESAPEYILRGGGVPPGPMKFQLKRGMWVH